MLIFAAVARGAPQERRATFRRVTLICATPPSASAPMLRFLTGEICPDRLLALRLREIW
jgi:hypothetical protein